MFGTNLSRSIVSSGILVARHGCHPAVLSRTTVKIFDQSFSQFAVFRHHEKPAGQIGLPMSSFAERYRPYSQQAKRAEPGDARLASEKQATEPTEKESMKIGQFGFVEDLDILQHFRAPHKPVSYDSSFEPLWEPIWSTKELKQIEITHRKPDVMADKIALLGVSGLRRFADYVCKYKNKPRTQNVWMNRILFLELFSGVLSRASAKGAISYRKHAEVPALLEEERNKHFHLLTALEMREPDYFPHLLVVGIQGVAEAFFTLAYLVSPRFCHSFSAYLSQDAVVMYTKCIKDMETGLIQHWREAPASDVAKIYWRLDEEATIYDVIRAIRADQAHHRMVNHILAVKALTRRTSEDD